MKALGFYPYQRFSLDSKLPADAYERSDFGPYVRETVYEYRGTGWSLLVSRDGLVQYHCSRLEEESEAIEQTWAKDLSTARSFEPLWQTYLAHLNVIYFMLECSMHLNTNITAFEFFELNYLDTTRITYDGATATRFAKKGTT